MQNSNSSNPTRIKQQHDCLPNESNFLATGMMNMSAAYSSLHSIKQQYYNVSIASLIACE